MFSQHFPTRRITVELDNYCNLASVHLDCPAQFQDGKTKLPLGTIYDIIDTAGKYNYNGAFAWHMYNEPCVDRQRLLDVCRRVRDKCPTSVGSLIWTNGDYLNERFVRDLMVAKVYAFRVSVYTSQAADRLRELVLAVPTAPWYFSEFLQYFDNRMEHYDETAHDPRPCHAPLTDITINHQGKIVMCCMDWKFMQNFGDVKELGFELAMKNALEYMEEAQAILESGAKPFATCRGCKLVRPPHPENVVGAKFPNPTKLVDDKLKAHDPREKGPA
jgi:hypothetical protein